MNELVLAGLLGGVGGLTMGVVGLLKALALKIFKTEKVMVVPSKK